MRGAAWLAACALAAASFVAPADALFFYIVDGSQRCFIHEVPEGTLVVGTYNNPDMPPGGAVTIRILVTDPAGQVLFQRAADAKGKFAFTSQRGGEHVLCFSSTSSSWFGQPRKYRFELRLDSGEMAVDYEEVAKKEHLSEVEVEVRRLNDKVKDILKEQSYQRERETMFRNTSESTNERVQWWSIFQMIVLIASGAWQVMHLKSFLRNEKIK